MNRGAPKRRAQSLSNRRFIFLLSLAVLYWNGGLGGALVAADDILPPRMTSPVEPEYPAGLLEAGVEGRVDVVFQVDRRGSVRDAEIQYATHKEFGEAVKSVVSRWRFEPATSRGRPVDLRVRMPVVFVITQADPLSKWAGRKVFKSMETLGVLDADELEVWPEPAAWIEPYYPPQLNGSGKRGEVLVGFVVDEYGDVVNPEILAGDDPYFIAAALVATLSLEFSPHLNAAGDAVPVSMAVSYKFDEKKQQQWDKAVQGKTNR
jgi:TonB family protein